MVCMVGYFAKVLNPTRSDRNKKPPTYIRWAVGVSNWRVFVTRTRESHPRFIFNLDGTLASPPPGCRVRF